MLLKSLLIITPLIVSVFGLQDCCYEDVTDGGTVCLLSTAALPLITKHYLSCVPY